MDKSSQSIKEWILAGLIGISLFIAFDQHTFPSASIDIKLDKKDILQKADTFVQNQGFDLQGYEQTIIFDSCSTVYLQKTQGLKRTNELLGKEIPCWGWTIRYFKELAKEGFYVSLDPTTGKLISFHHSLMEDVEGANLEQTQAQKIAENILQSQDEVLQLQELKDSSTIKQDNRTDHNFVWEKKDYKIDEATLRLQIGIQGDKLGVFDKYLDVPEQFTRDLIKESNTGMALSFVFGLAIVFLFLAAIAMLMRQYKHSHVNWRLAALFGILLVPLAILSFFNGLPLLWSAYVDTFSKNLFFWMAFGGSIVAAIMAGLKIFLFCAAGESLARDMNLPTFSLFKALKQRPLPKTYVMTIYIVGYSLAGIFLGYVTLFYLIGTQFLDIWMPMSSSYSNILGTSMPFLFPLTIAAAAAISEEFMFRLFAIPFFKKYLKHTWLAVLIPAVIWAFAHSSYPIFPNYVRGIELTVVGIIFGWVYLRFGIEATMIAHFVINAVLVGWPLLNSSNLYFQSSGYIVLALTLLPLLAVPFLTKKPSAAMS